VPSACPPADRLVSDWYGATCRQLGASLEYAVLSTLLGQLRAEYDRPVQDVSSEILQLLLATVLLQVDRLSRPEGGGDPHAGGEVYARFRAELERSYATTRRAADYAQRLGYTVKTLTRACAAATGQPVKHVIDGRVALEARRPPRPHRRAGGDHRTAPRLPGTHQLRQVLRSSHGHAARHVPAGASKPAGDARRGCGMIGGRGARRKGVSEP
jgi:AraC-like DNA-binding protein